MQGRKSNKGTKAYLCATCSIRAMSEKQTPPCYSWVRIRQNCAEIDEAKWCNRVTESQEANGMGTVDERLQGTDKSYREV